MKSEAFRYILDRKSNMSLIPWVPSLTGGLSISGGFLRRIKKLFCIFVCLCCCSCLPGTVVQEKTDVFKPAAYKTVAGDGWTITADRFKKNNLSGEKLPVVLCHGFNHNGRIWYLDGNNSLAYCLYKMGYDVWVVNLRGAGNSTKTGLSELRSLSRFEILKYPETLVKASLALNKLNWNIDDYINKDIPAILELVKKETGHREVIWIGHSLGGMIAYGYLGNGGEGIERLITIASPMIVPQPPNDLLIAIRDQVAVMYLSLIVNRTVASQLQAASGGTLRTQFDYLFYNAENMTKDMIVRMYRHTVEDVSPGVIDQLRQMIAGGDFVSSDKKIDYSKNLGNIKIPVLCMGGAYDNLAPPMSIYYAYNNISSKDKKIRIFSVANGYSANYGHNDLLIGKKSTAEVYPYILKWLKNRTRL